MNQSIIQFADALVFVHGERAEEEAARHAALCEKSGDMRYARLWRQVQRMVRDWETSLAA
jgi:hypothetical protein